MAHPESLIGPQLDLASSPDGLADEPLELGNQLVCVDQLRMQRLPPGKDEKLRRQLCSPIDGTPCGRGELMNPAVIRSFLDEFEVPGDHHKQVVEVVRDAARKLADGFHFLALLKLLLDETARLHSVLMLGDVSDIDREALAGGERIDRIPAIAVGAERFE